MNEFGKKNKYNHRNKIIQEYMHQVKSLSRVISYASIFQFITLQREMFTDTIKEDC